jgi:plastocyanin
MDGMRRYALALLAVAGLGTAVAGSSLAGVHAPTATTNVTVHMIEYAFQLSQNTAPVGTVVFTVINDGDIQHDFSIAGKSTPLLNKGQSATLTVTFTRAGGNPYLCTVGEHAVQGMQGIFTITGTGTAPKPTATIKVSETEFKIALLPKRVKHGLIRFVVKNNGKLPHNFVIRGRQTPVIKPGKSASINVQLPKGKYKYVCSIKGHAAAGMKGVLVVT